MNYEIADDALKEFLCAHRLTTQQHFRSCGLFNGHPPILFRLYEKPGMTVKELAAGMLVSPASVCTSLKRMESVGLVRREADENDRRVVRFYLTAEGCETHKRCFEGRAYLQSRQFAGMSDDELQELKRLLDKMSANLATVSAELASGCEEMEETL